MHVLQPSLVIFHQLYAHISQNRGSDWYKSYDTKQTKMQVVVFTKLQKTGNGTICIFWHNFWFRLIKHLSLMKDEIRDVRNWCKMAIYQSI